MRDSAPRTVLKQLLQGLSTILFAIAGLSFFFGGRVISSFGRVDRTLAEVMGIGFTFLCLIAGVVARHKIDDIEWEDANEEALKEAAQHKTKS